MGVATTIVLARSANLKSNSSRCSLDRGRFTSSERALDAQRRDGDAVSAEFHPSERPAPRRGAEAIRSEVDANANPQLTIRRRRQLVHLAIIARRANDWYASGGERLRGGTQRGGMTDSPQRNRTGGAAYVTGEEPEQEFAAIAAGRGELSLCSVEELVEVLRCPSTWCGMLVRCSSLAQSQHPLLAG